MHCLGHWALRAGLPIMVVMYVPFGPLALVMLLLPLYLHYLYLFSHFLMLLPFLQGRCAFSSKVAHLRDPEFRKLAEGLPLRAAKAKAPSTRSVARELSRNLENCLLALKRSFACPLMSCQVPFTWSFCCSRVSHTPHWSLPVMA